jgi:asparagine synthase (glutamine-hydrolysing)
MCDRIAHRGPDDHGVWLDGEVGIALGHRRLAIVDLSPQGHQPMVSHCGRYVVVFNGEIYNHLELREGLNGVPWRGHSDTESVLASFSRYGVIDSLPKLVGMFAFAVWDRNERRLTLVRDRMGEKPMYFGSLPSGEILFGSELHALRAHPRWVGEIDRNAVASYMRYNYVPTPYSIYKGIAKLRPGQWVQFTRAGERRDGCYWSVQDAAARGQRQPVKSDEEAVALLEDRLGSAVGSQLMADVPLGAFLSGGVDSSTVVALMTKKSTGRVRTFSIGFHEKGFDEAQYAKAVAKHLGTDHTELYATPQDALAVIPKLPDMYDEPFSDSSQIPTALIMQLARRHVTVALSGDGGDELFAGYNRYLLARRVWKCIATVPAVIRNAMAAAILAVPPAAWDAAGAVASRAFPENRRTGAVGDKVHKFASTAMRAKSIHSMYRMLVSHWDHPEELVVGGFELPTWVSDPDAWSLRSDQIDAMSLIDQLSYLPDDILVKVDRAAMAVSLETRVPLLDYRVVEFAWGLPPHQKIRDGVSKWLLRQVLYRYVPKALIDRPKQGFGVPLAQWLRGPLRDWAESLISPERLRNGGMLNASLVRRVWSEHLSGRRNWQYWIWDVLMYQAWLDGQRAEGGARCCVASSTFGQKV